MPTAIVMTVCSKHDDGAPLDEKPDPEITADLFRQWRSPRFGQRNPERMNNPVWEWLARSKLNAYSATQQFNGPSANEAGPGWCFDRFGQSSTLLPDGRTVLIAGEHEDHYDPDFYIYNDVVIMHPDEKIDIFGYPRDVFPPTDFHTATLVGNHIIMVGSLGYPGERKREFTPVSVLDLDKFSISKITTAGVPPGWLHGHNATLSPDATWILIQRGELDRCDGDGSLVENIDDWRLRLADWRWERLTERRWQRLDLRRKDRRPNRLWRIGQAKFYRDANLVQELFDQMDALRKECGIEPNLDIAESLYRPAVPHEEIPKVDEEYNVFRIKIEGVLIRYVEESHSIRVTVEGDLPKVVVDALVSELIGKLSALENTPYECKQL